MPRVYYDIDFSSPRHTAGQVPNVSSSAEDISKIVFGQPIVTNSQDATRRSVSGF